MKIARFSPFAAVLVLAACSQPAAPPPKPAASAPADVAAIQKEAHDGYLAAINSNNVEAVTDMMTDDVVYQAPNEPEIVGQDAVRKWAEAYVDAYSFKWERTSVGFTVAGDWAFERYAYKLVNTDRKTGKDYPEDGKGVSVFHHDADGKWRVAIDSWSPNASPTP